MPPQQTMTMAMTMTTTASMTTKTTTTTWKEIANNKNNEGDVNGDDNTKDDRWRQCQRPRHNGDNDQDAMATSDNDQDTTATTKTVTK